MAAAATTTDTRHHHDGHGAHAVDRKTHGFRSAFLSPMLYWLGSMAWLAGAATHLAVQPRDGYRIGGERRFTAGSALFVAGAGLFVLASLIGLAAAYAEAALVSGSGLGGGGSRRDTSTHSLTSASLLWHVRTSRVGVTIQVARMLCQLRAACG